MSLLPSWPRRSAWCVAACCLILPGLAAGVTLSDAVQEKLCVAGVVDKDKLAAYLIDKHPLSMHVFAAHPELAPADPLRQTLGALLHDSQACTGKCGSGDQAKLNSIRIEAINMLAGYDVRYARSSATEADRYFAGAPGADPIACLTQGASQAGEESAPPDKARHRWRVRGDVGQLGIEQGSKLFKTVDKAIVSLSRDELTDTRTARVFGYLGYRVPLGGRNGNRSDLIPYLGINRNHVRVDGVFANDKSSDTVDAGVTLYLLRPKGSATGSGIGHAVNLSADYLADRLDGSRLASMTLDYRPLKTHFVNGVVEWNGINLFPTLALRAKAGHYARRAAGTAGDAQENFARAGVALGVVVAADDNARFPLELSNSYVGLASSGGKPAVSHFKHSLSYSIGTDGLVGLSLNYDHGRREDTLKYERLWELALSIRY